MEVLDLSPSGGAACLPLNSQRKKKKKERKKEKK